MINFTDPPSGSADVECQLLEAAKAGDSEQVQRLLTAYPQIVNCRDLDGRWVFMVHAVLNRILHLHMTWTNHASGRQDFPAGEIFLDCVV